MDGITIIEPVCYLFPHKEQLVASHPSMRGVWRTCSFLLKNHKRALLSPLLIDDLKRDGCICEQSIEDFMIHTGKNFNSLPWFGEPILESTIEKRFGDLGCKLFDSRYHSTVLLPLSLLGNDWRWIVVHPIILQNQQSGMLSDLFKIIHQNVNFSSLGHFDYIKSELIKDNIREKFLNHFNYIWIDQEGRIDSRTHPVYKGGKIIHELLLD